MLIDKQNSALLIFNIQMDIIPLLENGQKLLDDCCWLADMAKMLNLSMVVFEHKRLGKTAQSLVNITNGVQYLEKITFDALSDPSAANYLESLHKTQFIIAGAELHADILQTAIALKMLGKQVFIVTDAVSARNKVDHDCALQRLQAYGIELVTKEMVFFELIRNSEYPNYINMSLKLLDGRYIRT